MLIYIVAPDALLFAKTKISTPNYRNMSISKTQKFVVQEFIDGYKKWTTESVLRLREESCVHYMLPASLGIPPKPNRAYGELFGKLEGTLTDFKVRAPVLRAT